MATSFLSSTIQLPANALKSILFSTSALLLQLSITNLFSLLAARHDAFTTYLILSEPLAQQLLYILHRRSLLVLSFLCLFTAAGLWATLLWGLDRPGYTLHTRRIGADALARHFRPTPAYVVISQSAPGRVDALDLVADISAGLFAGLNGTLTPQVSPGTPQAHPAQGARIVLDVHGWSVSTDALAALAASGECPPTTVGAETSWDCKLSYATNPRVGADFFEAPFARPAVWWEDTGDELAYDVLAPERGVNAWTTLGSGGDSVLMKTVFALARGTRRHVFVMSAAKSTVLALGAAGTVQMADVRELVQRTWRGESAELMAADLSAVEAALGTPETGMLRGRRSSEGGRLTSRAYQLVAVKGGDTTLFSAFQILDVNLTLVHSETVQAAPVPFEACDTAYSNIAYAGVVSGSTCFLALPGAAVGGVLQGQMDTLAVFILSRTLAKPRATTAADALNPDAWRWTQANDAAIEALVLARAYVVSGNAAAVQVDVQVLRPAVSLLQVVLVLLPVLLFVLSWGVVRGFVDAHFRASLFANLVAVTHAGFEPDSPDCMKAPPEVRVVRVQERVYLGTETGVFWHTGQGQGQAVKEA